MTTELVPQAGETCAYPTSGESGRQSGPSTFVYTPRVDIAESPDELTIYVDLPGASPEQTDVRFDQGELTIHAKTPPRYEGRFLCREYGVGEFRRSFAIHELVDSQRMSAELKNGVLAVRLPKSAAAKPRRIAVNAP